MAGTTTIAIFFDGNVVFTDCIPLGGKHITNDIARGLSTSIINAERIKTLHGNAFLSPFEDRETIEIRKSAKKIVLRPTLLRSQKSFKLFNLGSRKLWSSLEKVFLILEFEGIAGHRIVLTGGASQLPGMREIVQEKFKTSAGRQALRVNGLADSVSGPAFSTCVGLCPMQSIQDLIDPKLLGLVRMNLLGC